MISLICATGLAGELGYKNKLLCNLKGDLKHFKSVTNGKKIIMGRKTFESLPGYLPNRWHIVITTNTEYTINENYGEVVNDYRKLIELYKDSEEEVFIIGGAQIYELFFDSCNDIYHTQIFETFDKCDAYFKMYIPEEFYFRVKTHTDDYITENGIRYSIRHYRKR